MSNAEHIELPEISATVDATEKMLADAAAEVEAGADPLENLSMHELHLIETGEAGPELMALVSGATQEDGAQVENSTFEPDAAVDNMQALQAGDDLQAFNAPEARDFAAEFGQLEASRTELTDKLAALVQSVEDGDQLESEVLAEKLELQDKISALAMDRRQLEQQQQGYEQQLQKFEAQQQQAAQAWQKTCTDFVGVTHKDFYLGADGKPNGERLADLDAVIKSTAAANPTMRDAEVLAKAHEKVARMHGVEAKPAEAKPATTAKPQLPPTLGGMPRAEAANTGGQFAALHAAKGDALINALARMTPEQQEAYLLED